MVNTETSTHEFYKHEENAFQLSNQVSSIKYVKKEKIFEICLSTQKI